MRHEVIDRPPPARRLWSWPQRGSAARVRHDDPATRFAEICAAIGGTTMLHDLLPHLVTVSFGARTREIWERLRSSGWPSAGLGDWDGEHVLGVSFGGDRRAASKADALANALIRVVGELEVAETRSG